MQYESPNQPNPTQQMPAPCQPRTLLKSSSSQAPLPILVENTANNDAAPTTPAATMLPSTLNAMRNGPIGKTQCFAGDAWHRPAGQLSLLPRGDGTTPRRKNTSLQGLVASRTPWVARGAPRYPGVLRYIHRCTLWCPGFLRISRYVPCSPGVPKETKVSCMGYSGSPRG